MSLKELRDLLAKYGDIRLVDLKKVLIENGA